MSIFIEILSITALLVAGTRLLFISRFSPIINDYYTVIFATAFIYAPVIILRLKKLPIDFLDSSVGAYLKSFLTFLVTSIVVFIPYLILAHLWMIYVFGYKGFVIAPYPDLLKMIAFQVLLIALPEEFFFRGYMQERLNTIFPKKWRLFGATFGWSLIITSFIFAISHSIVNYRWWHFSIFFPSLLFGWLKEKTGTITAPVLFHATSNIISDYIARSYF